jgi:E1A/CREB-binding protein
VKYNTPIESVEKCPNLSLRLVSSYDKSHIVREGVFERYKHKEYPSEFPCRTKCLVLFQNIDGQDVILFGMYVYEYGHKCPAPNQRRVYISYLDSVHYFRPKQYRTVVYHEIIISYLEYVKARGFHTAHIWACPPLKVCIYLYLYMDLCMYVCIYVCIYIYIYKHVNTHL